RPPGTGRPHHLALRTAHPPGRRHGCRRVCPILPQQRRARKLPLPELSEGNRSHLRQGPYVHHDLRGIQKSPCRRTAEAAELHGRTQNSGVQRSQKRPQSQQKLRYRTGRPQPQDEPALQDTHPSRRTDGVDQPPPPELSADQIYTAEQAELRAASQEIPAADQPSDLTQKTIYTE